MYADGHDDGASPTNTAACVQTGHSIAGVWLSAQLPEVLVIV